jgi:hypothetical protein
MKHDYRVDRADGATTYFAFTDTTDDSILRDIGLSDSELFKVQPNIQSFVRLFGRMAAAAKPSPRQLPKSKESLIPTRRQGCASLQQIRDPIWAMIYLLDACGSHGRWIKSPLCASRQWRRDGNESPLCAVRKHFGYLSGPEFLLHATPERRTKEISVPLE